MGEDFCSISKREITPLYASILYSTMIDVYIYLIIDSVHVLLMLKESNSVAMEYKCES